MGKRDGYFRRQFKNNNNNHTNNWKGKTASVFLGNTVREFCVSRTPRIGPRNICVSWKTSAEHCLSHLFISACTVLLLYVNYFHTVDKINLIRGEIKRRLEFYL